MLDATPLHHIPYLVIGIRYMPINLFPGDPPDKLREARPSKRPKAMVSKPIEKNRKARQNRIENPHLLREFIILRVY